MIRFKAAVEEPGSKLSITQPVNVPPWKQGLIELCINPDGSLNVELYRLAFLPGIRVGEFHDICEVVISYRDYVDTYRHFIATSAATPGKQGTKQKDVEKGNVDALVHMARAMGARETELGESAPDVLTYERREHV